MRPDRITDERLRMTVELGFRRVLRLRAAIAREEAGRG